MPTAFSVGPPRFPSQGTPSALHEADVYWPMDRLEEAGTSGLTLHDVGELGILLSGKQVHRAFL